MSEKEKALFSKRMDDLSVDCQSEHRCGLRDGLRLTVEHPKPAQARRKVLGGHALEAAQPAAQAAHVGVDVLHVPRPIYAYSGAEVQAMVLHAQEGSGGRERVATIGAKNSVLKFRT